MKNGIHEYYMARCIELAKLGAGGTKSNPMVGSVLVHNDRVIGEGYHQKYGEAHAEVNCINSVQDIDLHLVEHATIYVSLEPCAHFGKTPPCADLIISRKIKHAVIGCRDPFPAVNGKGIEKLEAAGVEVLVGVLENKCLSLNKRFFTFHQQYRPYVILKWAQTADGFIGSNDQRLLITNDFTNRLVHRWRSEEMAIMVGKNTALRDNPSLTTRLWFGNNPVRIVTDSNLQIPHNAHLMDGSVHTIVFNSLKDELKDNIEFIKFEVREEPVEIIAVNDADDEQDLAVKLVEKYGSKAAGKELIMGMMEALYMRNITSVLVEGGATLLQSFIDAGCWDEARVITNTRLLAGSGVKAPVAGIPSDAESFMIADDQVTIFERQR
ncbi:MAG: bifunctional diaminohydroxyphosphoribosylaminopyrimidine deaminase/5-amino-6-(5-phosphoribosylamino)uracil reductase RibD [Flavitalea sp.]